MSNEILRTVMMLITAEADIVQCDMKGKLVTVFEDFLARLALFRVVTRVLSVGHVQVGMQ